MIERIFDARRTDLGGFEVGRVLPYAKQRMVGPFVFLDHIGPAHMPPGHGVDVRPHPHIGLATVTYLLQGAIHHRDSLGTSAVIRPGEVNWMTAGRGISHSERTDPDVRAAGGPVHGLQAWVALPAEDEEIAPSFAHAGAEELPRWEETGVSARLVVGTAWGATAPIPTRSPLFYVVGELASNATMQVPSEHEERAAYVLSGAVWVGDTRVEAGKAVVFGAGDARVVADGAATVALLGGANIGPRHIWWNFVSSRQDRIEQARADWAEGRFALPPDDNGEWIPLPTGR